MEPRARLVGFNHVAVEVDDVDEALEFYGRVFDFELRGRGPKMAFIDAGDQFIAVAGGRTQPPDTHRHIGIVVDDRKAVRRALREMDVEILPGRGLDFLDPGGDRWRGGALRGRGVETLPGRGLDFLDPWGNRWQVVEYRDVQFTKAPEVLRGMDLDGLEKSSKAAEELRNKGLVSG